MAEPHLTIEIGNIINNEKYYIKKGTIINNSLPLGPDCKPLQFYDNGSYVNSNWCVKEDIPEYTYNDITKMWTLDGINDKYECYFCEIPEDCLKWVNHLTDITVEMTFLIEDNTTLYGDGTTNDVASFFSWRNLFEFDLNDNKPEWPDTQENFKIYRGTNELSIGYDNFVLNNNTALNMKINKINKLYWRLEQEPYKDFYPSEKDYDGDFLYPDNDDFRLCRGWNTNNNIDKDIIDQIKRYVPSNELQQKYKTSWNIKNCERIQSESGDKIRFKFFYNKDGNVFKKYTFKDFKIKISIPYYSYYKNLTINNTLQNDSIRDTNNFFKTWSKINYKYSMFTRKTETTGNTTIQNTGLLAENRMSNMQRLWIALCGGKNLKDETGYDFIIDDNQKFGRSKLINTLSPMQQLLWITWHTDNINGTWKGYALPNYSSGVLNEMHINIFITEILWLWQSVLDILPTSDNNFNTDKIPGDNIGGIKNNNSNYYNKRFYFEIIKELMGWPIPILKNVSDIINHWIPPKFNLQIDNNNESLDILTSSIETIQNDKSNKLNLFYTIPPLPKLESNRYTNYIGNYLNNHAFDMITEENFVNRLNTDKTGDGWFSTEGNTKKYNIPVLGKNNDGSRISSDENYMYRISDTPKPNHTRGISINLKDENINGTLHAHGGLIIRLPKEYSKYSMDWGNGVNYIPKITKIKIELDFAIKQFDENSLHNNIPVVPILSTSPKNPLLCLSNNINRNISKNYNLYNAWKYSGQITADSENKSLNKITILNDKNIIANNVNSAEELIDNARYKLIYTIDNLPVINPGEQNPIVDPLTSGLLVQIDYSKAIGQENIGVKTLRTNDYSATNGILFDGLNDAANYSMSPNSVGNIFKNNDEFSFSVHKNEMEGLVENENTEKHLGVYLFYGINAQSSYFFKNINIELEIPELTLQNVINECEGIESDYKIDILTKAIEKAENVYTGVIDSEILSYARKRLNTMNIILSIDAVNDLPTNTLNIESLQNIIANLNLTINDVDYDEQLLYENKLAIMQTHQEFLVFSSNLDNPLNTINDVLTNVNVNNILQKRIELDSLGNKSVIEEYVSLFNTKDILNKLSILNIEKEKIILSFSEKIINIINDDSYNTLGNGKLKQSIFLLKELDASAFNMGLHSNQNITGVNFTPIQLYNNLKNTIDDRVVVIINDINDKIINSNENIDLHKLISILVNLDNENIELFDSDIYSNLLSRYNVAINHVRASVDLLIDEWEELKINPELWEKQEYWFDWLGESPSLDWNNSFFLNIYKIEKIQQYTNKVAKNLNLKVKNNFTLPINIYNVNKGIITTEDDIVFPIDSYLYTYSSSQSLRCNWKTNKYIQSFIDGVWIGNTDTSFVLSENILGQTTPWSTPLGDLTKRLKNISESFGNLSNIAKNGYPDKEKWMFPGIDITDIIINTNTGTASYPDRTYGENEMYLQKHTNEQDIIVLPPGPMTKLVEFLEKTIKINTNAYIYKLEKEKYYDTSIWIYEFALKYDTNTIQKKSFWTELALDHGLDVNNPELLDINQVVEENITNILFELSNLTAGQTVAFSENNFSLLPTIFNALIDADNNNIDDTFIEFKQARQLYDEQILILKNRVEMFTSSATINNYTLLENILDQAIQAKFNYFNDSNTEGTGIIDIYTKGIEKYQNILSGTTDNTNINLKTKVDKWKSKDSVPKTSPSRTPKEIRQQQIQLEIGNANQLGGQLSTLTINQVRVIQKNRSKLIQDDRIDEAYNKIIESIEKYHKDRLYTVIDEMTRDKSKVPLRAIEYTNVSSRDQRILLEYPNPIESKVDLIFLRAVAIIGDAETAGANQGTNAWDWERAKDVVRILYENEVETSLKKSEAFINTISSNPLSANFTSVSMRNVYREYVLLQNIINPTPPQMVYKLWWASANPRTDPRTNLAKLKTNSDKMSKFISDLGGSIMDKRDEISAYLRNHKDGTTVYSNVDIQEWISYIKNSVSKINKYKLNSKITHGLTDLLKTLEELNTSLFSRSINGLYYNNGTTGADFFIKNSELNKDLFLSGDRVGNNAVSLYFKRGQYNHLLNVSFELKYPAGSTGVQKKDKIFLSIDDNIYIPNNYTYIINHISDSAQNIPINTNNIVITRFDDQSGYTLTKNYYDKILQTRLKTNYKYGTNGFLFPASNKNNTHKYMMTKKNVKAHIGKLSTSKKQARTRANTGSMGRLARLKAQNA